MLRTSGVSAMTETSSVTCPTSSGMSSRVAWAIWSTMPLCTNRLKPVCSTASAYSPGVSAVKVYWPSLFVLAVVEMFVATFVTVTATPGTTALFGSVTVPVSVERMVWAAAGAAAAVSTRISPVTVRLHRLELRVGFAMTDSHLTAMRGATIVGLAHRLVSGFHPGAQNAR